MDRGKFKESNFALSNGKPSKLKGSRVTACTGTYGRILEHFAVYLLIFKDLIFANIFFLAWQWRLDIDCSLVL